MSRKDFIIVALRLMAIYLAITGLSSFLPTFGMAVTAFFNDYDSSSYLLTMVGSSYGLLYLVACGLLWPLAPRVAARIEPDLPPDIGAEKTDNSDSNYLAIGLTLLGFFILSNAIPTLVKIITAMLLPSFDTNYSKAISNLNGEKVTIIPWSEIVYLISQLFIGMWFVLGASGIATFLKKVRYAGRSHATN